MPPGVISMLSEQDYSWLANAIEEPTREGTSISGTVRFSAVYNPTSNRFLILDEDTHPENGVFLAGEYRIKIEDRINTLDSRLPALFIEGTDPTMNRHFNQSDRSACLCSPFEEDGFIRPNFDIEKYFYELVIPFLYGQKFFDRESKWPWSELSHGAMGILESYESVGTTENANECLERILREKPVWKKAKVMLEMKHEIKGHYHCLCGKLDHFRRCHPQALAGLRRLRSDIKLHSLTLPDGMPLLSSSRERPLSSYTSLLLRFPSNSLFSDTLPYRRRYFM